VITPNLSAASALHCIVVLCRQRITLLPAALHATAAGDYTPDLAALLSADIIIATPEKWDGISRNWQSRGYVKKVRHPLLLVVLHYSCYFVAVKTVRWVVSASQSLAAAPSTGCAASVPAAAAAGCRLVC
jgi:hypothetical protein